MKVMYFGGTLFLSFVLSGCSLEASLVDLKAAYETYIAPHRSEADLQNTEIAVSGSYSIKGQVGEISEKQVSGNYVVEGVISYE